MAATKWVINTESSLVDKRAFVVAGSIFVGRDAGSCSLVIKKNEVSRRHAELLIKGENLYVKDLGSANGTFVNDERIPPNSEVQLKSGAKVRFEEVVFVVQGDQQAAASGTAVNPALKSAMMTSVATSVQSAVGGTAVQSSVDVMVRLVLVKGTSSGGQSFNIDGLTSVTIGRNPSCDIVLNDPTVSSEHIRLNSVDSGWEAICLSQTNGMFINGHKTLKAFIKNKDEIAIGGCVLRFDSKVNQSGVKASGNKIPDWMRQQG